MCEIEPTQLQQDYLQLLERDEREQCYQSYIETHTRLVPREFVLNHDIWAQVVLRKPPLGSDYKADFAFVTKSSIQWRCVFIEIETPGKRFFRAPSQVSRDFGLAIQQIADWRAWFDGHERERATEVMQPLLTFPQVNDRVDIRFILVYGRRAEFEGNQRRISKILAQQHDDLRIMSFDSLAEQLQSRSQLYLGVKHNDYIDLPSDEFISLEPFQAIEPENLRVNRPLLNAAKENLGASKRNLFGPFPSPTWKDTKDRLERVRVNHAEAPSARRRDGT